MRTLTFISFLLTACAHANSVNTEVTDTECVFTYIKSPSCTHKTGAYNIIVILHTKTIADEEIELIQATIDINGDLHTLNISEDTSMIQGNLGSVLFEDINFDGIPDLAISTSFGVANQYLDYWIYDTSNKSYALVGILPRLLINQKQKTLSSQMKINAVYYETQVFSWDGNKLIRNK